MAVFDRFQTPIPPFNARGPYVFLATYPGRFQTPVGSTTKKWLMMGQDHALNIWGVWEVASPTPDYAGSSAGSAVPAIALPARNIALLG